MRIFANFVDDGRGGYIDKISTHPNLFSKKDIILYTDNDLISVNSDLIYNEELGDRDWKIYSGEVFIDDGLVTKDGFYYKTWIPNIDMTTAYYGKRVSLYKEGRHIKDVVYKLVDQNLIDVTDKITKIIDD